jgi:hypothetical protein
MDVAAAYQFALKFGLADDANDTRKIIVGGASAGTVDEVSRALGHY